MPAEPAVARPAIALERWAALAAAAVVAVGVVGFDWSSFTVVGLYWLENVLIGVFTVARMLAALSLAERRTGTGGALFLVGFFTLHYGFFCFGHGVFVVALLGESAGAVPTGPFDPLGEIVGRLLAAPLGGLAVLAVALFVASDFARWLAQARREPPRANELMLAPYRRIVVLHIALLGGAFAMQLLALPQAVVLVLVLLKLAFDLREVRRPYTFAWQRIR